MTDWQFLATPALILLAALAYREGGRPTKHDWDQINQIRRFVPDYQPGRLRKVPKFLARGAAALFVAALVTPDPVALAIIALALAAGLTAAPGNAVAPALHGIRPDLNKRERWQFGPLLDNAWLSLAVLGFIRAVGVLLLPLYDSRFLPLAVTLVVVSVVAAPASVATARWALGGKLRFETGGSRAWAKETIRSNRMWGCHEYDYGGTLALLAFMVARIA